MILIATPDYISETGGTYRAVHDQICMQRLRGIETRVWARSGQDDQGILYSPQQIPWQRVAIVHFAAVWHPFHIQAWLSTVRRRKPWVVSPHGMYEPYILGRRPLLKRLVRWFVQDRILREALCIHATSQPEASQLQSLFPDTRVEIIPNAIDTGVFFPKPADGSMEGRRRVALFAGRLHPKKRPAELMEWWCENACDYPDWILEVASPQPGDDSYGYRCQRLLQRGISAGSIRYLGFLSASALAEAYRSAKLFVLPTLSENFCLAIGESLACGTPVITTYGAPWPILEKNNSGWWTDIDIDAFFTGLANALKAPSMELAAMGSRGAAFVQAELTREVIAEQWSLFWGDHLARLE